MPDELPPTELEPLMAQMDAADGRICHLKPVLDLSETPPSFSRPPVPLGYHRLRMDLEFRRDDLTGEQTRALIARHLAGMRANSPPESVHALEVDKLRSPDIKFWSVWSGEQIVGCGALKRLDPRRGELKSMRVADAFLSSLWLETGSGPAFEPALRLYESAGFSRCGPFDGYVEDPFSVFMTRAI